MGLDVERSFQESIRSLPRARKLAKALSTFEPQSAPAPLDQIIAAKWRALELGAPIRSALGEILEDYENARESRYEELAQALPIKLLLPLFCCIFPANLAILMIPAIPAFQGF
jgi:tight adherence protein C